MAAMSMVLLALAVIASGCGPTRGAQSLSAGRSTPVREILGNGVSVVVEERPSSDVVAVQLWVRAGARDESSSELGVAHYLEHMVFKGTSTRGAGFVDRDVERVGGRVNASTSLDYTYYHVLLPASRVIAGIEMLADIGANASLDETLLGQETSVVLQEMRLRDDNPRDLLARRLYSAVFGSHVYGRPTIGTPEVIRSVTRQTLAAFYRRHYVPESFTLVVVGAVRREEILGAATRTLGRLPRTGRTRLPVSVPTDPPPLQMHVAHPGTQLHLGLGWPGPKLDHADTPAVDLLVGILGRNRTSRLTQSLRERRGLVDAISMAYAALEGGGIVTIAAQLDPLKTEDATRAILDELHRVRNDGVTEGERRRAVTAIDARREFELETAEGRASALGRAETLWRISEELAYVDRVRSVTTEQLRAVARRYLDPERYARVTLGSGAR